jgi:hypothetical protein
LCNARCARCLLEQVRNHLVVLVLDGAQHRLVDLNPYSPALAGALSCLPACAALVRALQQLRALSSVV